ncbi:MAG: class I SAM-dependent methyltransferase [Paracoccaceae bacterium]
MDTDSESGQFPTSFFERQLPDARNGFPNGWMSPDDLQLLYNAAFQTTGSVLEVGPWLGRSTTALALGLRDRQKMGAAPVSFDTVDFGITSAQEWKQKFGEELDIEKQKGLVAEAVYHPGGTVAVLIQNMKSNRLLPYVSNFIRGDFIDCPIRRKYKLIFCDTTHDDNEIKRTLPKLSKMAGAGCVFVFDDVITEQRAELICSYLQTERYIMTSRIFPEKKKFCKVMLVETK